MIHASSRSFIHFRYKYNTLVDLYRISKILLLSYTDWILAVIAKLFADHIFNSKENIDENLLSLKNGSEVS